jgi:hypothetical protein
MASHTALGQPIPSHARVPRSTNDSDQAVRPEQVSARMSVPRRPLVSPWKNTMNRPTSAAGKLSLTLATLSILLLSSFIPVSGLFAADNAPLTVDQAEKLLDEATQGEVKGVLSAFDSIIDSLGTPAEVAKKVLADRDLFEKKKGSPDLSGGIYGNEVSASQRNSLYWALHRLAAKKASTTAELSPRIVSREVELRKKRLFDESIKERERVTGFSNKRYPPIDTLLAASQTWEGEGSFRVESKMPKTSAAEPQVQVSQVKARVTCRVLNADAEKWVLKIVLRLEDGKVDERTVTCRREWSLNHCKIDESYGRPFSVVYLHSGSGLPDNLSLALSRSFANGFQEQVLSYRSSGNVTFALKLISK